jgi:hypothetical protein
MFVLVEDDKSITLMRHIETLLSQAKDLIKQMEIEVRSQDGERIQTFVVYNLIC